MVQIEKKHCTNPVLVFHLLRKNIEMLQNRAVPVFSLPVKTEKWPRVEMSGRNPSVWSWLRRSVRAYDQLLRQKSQG